MVGWSLSARNTTRATSTILADFAHMMWRMVAHNCDGRCAQDHKRSRRSVGFSRGGFELGYAGDEDSAEVSLRRGIEVAGPVESVECEAKLFKGVARSGPSWFAEDHGLVG